MVKYIRLFAGHRLGARAFAAIFGALLAAPALGQEDTALDRYVTAPDPTYGYVLVNRISGNG